MAGSASAPRSRATVVAAGILSSRLLGLVRERIVATVLGIGAHTDVFTTALRLPNVLQNLLGEQTLSAAFIPIYSRMAEEGRERDARRFAGAAFSLLAAVAAGLALVGVALARPLVAISAYGFLDDAAEVAAGTAAVDRYELTVLAVRWVFPMAAVLVLSAWALGVLNSHRRFFLSYFSPVLWNLAIIGAFSAAAYALLPEGGVPPDLEVLDRLLFAGLTGALVGGLLQFLVQLPLVLRLLGGLEPSLSLRVPGLRRALAAFGPALAGRGVVQLSFYLDVFLASFLSVGSPSAVRWATFLYVLPVSLFGMSVAASELPELSRAKGEDRELIRRAERTLGQIAFLVLPTAVGYLVFGFLVVGAVFRGGEFTLTDNWLVYAVLAGYSLGLPATTASRLLQNLFFALGDTRTPARIAGVRVAVGAAVAASTMFWLDSLEVTAALGVEGAGPERFLGPLGLALGSAAGSAVELALLRRALTKRLDGFRLPAARAGRMLLLALAAAVPAACLWLLLPALPVFLAAALVLGCYAGVYLLVARFLGMPELSAWLGRLSG